MESRLELVFPSMEHKEQVMDFLQECLNNGEKHLPGSANLENAESYEAWLKKVTEDLAPEQEGRAPSTQYLAISKKDNKLIGLIQVRHNINTERLFNIGGHIGDCIRPSERKKGYATEMIGLALKKCKELGIGRVLMTCVKQNVASSRTIIKNGGVLENEINAEGEIYQRYWISLKKRYADRGNKKDMLETEYKNIRVDIEKFNGNISLLTIKKVRQEWYVDSENRCILANNYKWLEIYPDNENYCITAIYNDKGNIVEWYFDIADSIGETNGIPYEDDLYLDVVIVPDGRINILDEDELKDALDRREISQKQYDMAHKTADNIIETYGKNINNLKKFTDEYLKILEN